MILTPAAHVAIGKIGDLSTLYRCDNNEWCCSAHGNTTSCCPERNNQFRIPSIAQIQNGTDFVAGYTISPVASASLSPSTGTGPAPTRSPSSAGQDPASGTCPPAALASGSASGTDGNKNKALAAGLGAGLGIGIPSLAALAGTLFLLSRSRRENEGLKRNLAFQLPPNSGEKRPEEGGGLHELPNNARRTPELPGIAAAPK